MTGMGAGVGMSRVSRPDEEILLPRPRGSTSRMGPLTGESNRRAVIVVGGEAEPQLAGRAR